MLISVVPRSLLLELTYTSDELARLAGTPLLATLSRSFALATSLGALIVRTAAGLGQNAILLNFAVKLLER
jgi:hypothetical protein